MKFRSTLTAIAISTISVSGFASLSAQAAEPAKAASTSVKTEDNEMLKTSSDAQQALHDIRAARFAIFNGSLDLATKLVNRAGTKLEKAHSLEDTLAVQTKKAVPNGGVYVPVDVGLSLSGNFVPTKEKESLFQKVDDFLSRKDRKHAAEALKAANIDVTVSAALIPVDADLGHVQQASELIAKKKYYEANLALKAIEDSVVVDSYTTDNIPVQGSKKS